jgi:phage gp29-like protein
MKEHSIEKGLWITKDHFVTFAELNRKSLSRTIATREATWDFSGLIGILPDPDEVLKNSGNSVQILDSLLADAHVISSVQTRKLGTLKSQYYFQAGHLDNAEPDKISQKLADDFADDMWNLDLFSIISQILDAPLYGMVPVEIIWSADRNGRIRIKDLRPLPNRWFAYDEDNNLRFLSKKDAIAGELLPYGKFVVARHFPSYDNPYGLKLLSRCLWPVTFKRGGIKFWVTFAEKFGMPFILGKYLNPDDAEEMKSQLAAILQNAVAVVPNDADVSIIQGHGMDSTMLFDRLVFVMDSEISKAIIGQTLTTEMSGKHGSYAAAQVHKDTLSTYVASDRELVKNVFEDIAWLYGQINDPYAMSPTMQWETTEDIHAELAGRDKTLSDTGQIKFKKEYFVRKYDFEETDIEVVEKPAYNGYPAAFSEGSVTPDQKAIDRFLETVPPDSMQNLAEDALRPVIKLINSGSNYSEVMSKLASTYPKLKTAKLEELLARAIFVSDVWGRISNSSK